MYTEWNDDGETILLSRDIYPRNVQLWYYVIYI